MKDIPEHLEIKDTVLTGIKGGRTIESIAIPEGVTEIGRGAFGKCDKLKSIDIPKGVTEINENTFLDCHELASMTIPESVEIITFNAFGACLKLKMFATAALKNSG